MTAMLGVKLEPALERRISDFSRKRHMRKSEFARLAFVEYLNRHDDEGEFGRQLRELAPHERKDVVTQREIDEHDALAWQIADDLD
jgi:predicted transcriptional regulator